MNFDIFVLPFMAGTIFLLVYFMAWLVRWINELTTEDKKLLRKGIFSVKSLAAVKEIFFESLLHRKIFKVNRRLGYMHMSLAFGWFLLIIAGHFESKAFNPEGMNLPYYPIFFRFFEPDPGAFPYDRVYEFIMDLLLLVILSGVSLAYYKRFRSRALGMKKTTKLRPFDKLALTSLWMIFPMRLLAESFTSGIYETGGFMTGTLGSLFAKILPLDYMAYPAWWAYSISLGVFFVCLPFSRYMHIPTEPVLIFLRNYGIKTRGEYSGFSDVEVKSCSRCGICIDACQLSSSLGQTESQAVYFLRSVKDRELNQRLADNCMMCKRCTSVCPVGVCVNAHRKIVRKAIHPGFPADFSYIPPIRSKSAKVIYFAGCMGHLTPTVILAMKKILMAAGVDFWFMDEDGSVCCGRPLMLASRTGEAMALVEKNRKAILSSGATALVTSCPICMKVFTKEYALENIKVMHHSQYLLQLHRDGKLPLKQMNVTAVYHDPCELGRGLKIYDEPRELIHTFADLQPTPYDRENSLCCGGSLASNVMTRQERKKIACDVTMELAAGNPEYLVTSCPLCKKSFQLVSPVPVKDIAELVADAMQARRKPVLSVNPEQVSAVFY